MTVEFENVEKRLMLGLIKNQFEDSLEGVRDAEGTPVEEDMRFMARHNFGTFNDLAERLIESHKDDAGYEPSNVEDFVEVREELREELYGESETED